jgi:hypothetical protein
VTAPFLSVRGPTAPRPPSRRSARSPNAPAASGRREPSELASPPVIVTDLIRVSAPSAAEAVPIAGVTSSSVRSGRTRIPLFRALSLCPPRGLHPDPFHVAARRDADLLGEPAQLVRAHPGAARNRPPGRGMEPVPLLRGVLPVEAGESARNLAARAIAWSARTWPDDSRSDRRGSPEDLDGVGIRPARNTGSRPVVLRACNTGPYGPLN